MSRAIFISHAGADWPDVEAVAKRLRSEGLTPLVDREELALGDSFLSFMERSLRQADYCLLLWSRAAADSPWVRAEWEAAFHRTVTESQRFLIVAQLDDHPVPELLRPRLRVKLQRNMDAGMSTVVELVRRDNDAERDSGRQVCAPRCEMQTPAAGTAVYVSSELFAKTMPWHVDGEWPAAVATERLVAELGLPRQLDHEGRIGLRFHYGLALGDKVLEPGLSLASQGLKPHALLWLQTETLPFAASATTAGNIASATFRTAPRLPAAARTLLTGRIRQLGLDA